MTFHCLGNSFLEDCFICISDLGIITLLTNCSCSFLISSIIFVDSFGVIVLIDTFLGSVIVGLTISFIV